MPPVVSLDSLFVPQPFLNFRRCVRPVFTLDSFCEMAASVAGASGAGGGGGSDPPYPWRKDEVMDNLSPPPSQTEEEEELDLANFSRRLCKKCGKQEYLKKGGCANPSCVSRHNN